MTPEQMTEVEEALIQAAYLEIAIENNLTVVFASLNRPNVPSYYREESRARAMPYILAVQDLVNEPQA